MNKQIRNFTIIAHIDHGKSTLADRMLEVTKTVESRKMQDRVLDDMELERERGITIKMRPVRMETEINGEEYILNLIDTPGHIDFAYEVSRALKAVEGSILLVDATQGVQAQTLTTLDTAKQMGVKIIPVLSKIDSPNARIDEVRSEMRDLIGCDEDEILLCSGKTGEGVAELLEHVVATIPAPKIETTDRKEQSSLIFDFQYSNHKGVILYTRVFNGEVIKGEGLQFVVAGRTFTALETGIFAPQEVPVDKLQAGEIGYIVTGIKEPGVASVGDTVILKDSKVPAIPGYSAPKPVVWASVFPESQDDFDILRQALLRLRLSDASFTFEEESSGTLGRGFRCGFLGMLHLEIITERLRREFNLELIVTLPSITYQVLKKNGDFETIYSPSMFPDHGDVDAVEEPWVHMRLITPPEYVGDIMQLLYKHEGIILETENVGSRRNALVVDMPLRELMRNFFDELKSVSSGYASISYEIGEYKEAHVTKLEVHIAEEPVTAFTRIISIMRLQEDAKSMVERLYDILPRQMFVTKIQAKADGKIVASKTLSALKKNVTAHLYGGDITRKMKLREKQKKGKKRMQSQGKVHIGQDVFIKMMKNKD